MLPKKLCNKPFQGRTVYGSAKFVEKCSNRRGLRVHMRGHLGMMNYQCEECNKESWTKQALKGHVVQHTKVRTFNCESCEKKFAYRQSLMRHMKNGHGLESVPDLSSTKRSYFLQNWNT